MTIPSFRQSQFELFPGENSGQPRPPAKPFVIKDLTLNAENIIVLCIIFVVCMVLFFSFGVERGKRISFDRTIAAATTPPAMNPAVIDGNEVKAKITVVDESSAKAGLAAPNPEEKREVLELNIDEQLRYTIQVASYKREKDAKHEAKRLEDKGHKSFVVPKGAYSIVCVGRFPEKDDAQLYANKIKANYSDFLIRRL